MTSPRPHARHVLWLLAGASLLSSSPVCARSPAEHVEYKVLKGDTLYDLAIRYLANPGGYAVVQKLNRIVNPRRIPTGRTLKIPRALLRQEPIEATVLSYSGKVLVGARTAMVGMKVKEGDLLETADRSFVTLRLPDASTVSLPSRALVMVELLRRTLLADSVERRFTIARGQATGSVTPMTDPHSTFQFQTPRAMTSVRGTRFRVNYDPQDSSSRVEVVEGKVAFRESGQVEQLVAAGFGTKDSLPDPVPLLPPPALTAADKVQDEEALRFALQPVAGAAAYHIQIARDAGFLEAIDETRSDGPEAQFSGIGNGTYFVRSSAIDANGLEGLPSTYSFERRLNRLRTSIEEGRAGKCRQYLFRWDAPDLGPDLAGTQFRFQLSRNPDGSGAVADQTGLKGSSFIITDLPGGTYYWRVMSMTTGPERIYTKWSSTNELRVGAGK